MQHYFDSCPDCGEYYGKVGNMPELDRHTKIYSGDSVVKSRVRAICNRCGWETKSHDNVGECAKEWNNTNLYDGQTANETPKTCKDCGNYLGVFGCNIYSAYHYCADDTVTCSRFVAKQ